jgi:hypothetical protein
VHREPRLVRQFPGSDEEFFRVPKAVISRTAFLRDSPLIFVSSEPTGPKWSDAASSYNIGNIWLRFAAIIGG